MRWETHVFSGSTVEEATAAMHAWLGTDQFNTVNQRIMIVNGQLSMYLSHCPMMDGHRIYLTALMGAPT